MNVVEKVEICKLVAHAILVDARITDAEREFLAKLMQRYGLTAAQQKEVLARNIDEDPKKIADLIVDTEAKNALLAELAMAVTVDGEISSSEMALLTRVAEVIEVTSAELELLLNAAIS